MTEVIGIYVTMMAYTVIVIIPGVQERQAYPAGKILVNGTITTINCVHSGIDPYYDFLCNYISDTNYINKLKLFKSI